MTKEEITFKNKVIFRKPRLDQGADYERGFIDGMQYQMQTSVDKAVNAMSQQEQGKPVEWDDLLKDAQQIVKNKFLYKKFIDGTPLSNDIPCWMADFAQQYTTPQGCDECGVSGGYALYCLACSEKFFGKGKEWVGLTTEQMMAIAEWQISAHRPLIDVIKAVEQALKEKNT